MLALPAKIPTALTTNPKEKLPPSVQITPSVEYSRVQVFTTLLTLKYRGATLGIAVFNFTVGNPPVNVAAKMKFDAAPIEYTSNLTKVRASWSTSRPLIA